MYILTNELLIIYTNKNVTSVQLNCNKNLFTEKFHLFLSADISLNEILFML